MAEASVSPKPFSPERATAPKLASPPAAKLDSAPGAAPAAALVAQPEPPLLELVDSHAHIDASEFDTDRDAMLARARAAGVETILAIGGGGADPASLATSIPFAERHDWIYAAAGIHPHEAQLATPAHYDVLSRLASHPRFLAWGEIGLDYHYDHSPRDVQQRVFLEQLDLARAAGLPVILHCRDAWADCLAVLDAHWRTSGLGGIFHCFTGTLDEARRGIEMGFLVSFAGNVTFPKAQNLRTVAAALPLASILIETDSPFLAPQPHRGRRNEPAYVAEVARTLGPVRDLAPTEFASAAAANFRRFFGLQGLRDLSGGSYLAGDC
jgi:TatD DNase family protein